MVLPIPRVIIVIGQNKKVFKPKYIILHIVQIYYLSNLVVGIYYLLNYFCIS